MEAVLTRDTVAPQTKTAYPTNLANFDPTRVNAVRVTNPFWGMFAMTVLAYDTTNWADAAKPDGVDQVMFSERDRQWKASRWIIGGLGEELILDVEPYNLRAPTP